MDAVILAGGKGTRLLPLTSLIPKPLVPVGEEPIIDIVARQLSRAGYKRIHLSVGYRAELIKAFFEDRGDKYNGTELAYYKEEKPLGTAGPLALLPRFEDTFLVMNGDILTNLDFEAFRAYHKTSAAILTIARHEKRIPIDLGILELDADGHVVGYREKPTLSSPVSMGIYLYEPEALKYVEQGESLDFPDLTLRLIKAGHRVAAYQNNARWLDIGRPEDYAQAETEFLENRELYWAE